MCVCVSTERVFSKSTRSVRGPCPGFPLTVQNNAVGGNSTGRNSVLWDRYYRPDTTGPPSTTCHLPFVNSNLSSYCMVCIVDDVVVGWCLRSVL